jgi:hypothetical protein
MASPQAADGSPRRVERMASPQAADGSPGPVERKAGPPAADGSPHPVECMASPPAADRSIFVFTGDYTDCSLFYGVRLEAVPPPSANSDDAPPSMELRLTADPVLRWSEEGRQLSDVAAVSGGTILCLIHGSRRTVICDTASGTNTPGPRLHRSKRRPVMLPVGGDGTVLVMDKILRPGHCCFEALRRRPNGGWGADALPDPPVPLVEGSSRFCRFANPLVSAYFAIGSRVWISLTKMGTFSLDMETGTWRMEGTWQLPLENLGIFVPELGVVMGIASVIDFEPHDPWCCQVCALGIVESQHPVVRRVWEIPAERPEDVAPAEAVSLACLGNGRLCISRSIIVRGVPSGDTGTSFMLVDVSRSPNGDLELVKHGNVYCHLWPWRHIGHASFLQPA